MVRGERESGAQAEAASPSSGAVQEARPYKRRGDGRAAETASVQGAAHAAPFYSAIPLRGARNGFDAVGNLRRGAWYRAIPRKSVTTARREDYGSVQLELGSDARASDRGGGQKDGAGGRGWMKGSSSREQSNLNAGDRQVRPGPRRPRGRCFRFGYHAEIIRRRRARTRCRT